MACDLQVASNDDDADADDDDDNDVDADDDDNDAEDNAAKSLLLDKFSITDDN